MVIGGGAMPVDDQCPTCDRAIHYMTDFPLVQVVSVDGIVTAGKVPDILPHGAATELIEGKKWYSFLEDRPIVPSEVVRHFNSGSTARNYLHTDGHVYYPSHHDNNGRQIWGSKRNYAAEVRSVLQEDREVPTYLHSLEKRIGQEMPTHDIFPTWPITRFADEGKLFFIPQPGGSPIPYLYLRTHYNGASPRSASLCLATRVSRQGDVETVLEIAKLRYVGKLRAPVAPSAPPLAAVG